MNDVVMAYSYGKFVAFRAINIGIFCCSSSIAIQFLASHFYY